MTSGSASARRSDPRRRLIALALLLVLSLGLAAALAVQAIQTARRHRQTAERALQDYADFGAFILASRVYRQLGYDVLQVFAAPAVAWPAPGAAGRMPGLVCPRGMTSFVQAPGGGAIRTAGAPLDSTDFAILADTLRNARALLDEAAWRFRWIRTPKAAQVQGFFIVSHQRPDRQYELRGFSACFSGNDSPFRAMMLSESALPPAITQARPADSLFSLDVVSVDGASLYASPVRYDSPYRGTSRLGVEFGDLAVRVVLRGDLASLLVAGGLPASPMPLAIGLLALSTLLVVTALLQLRREYELIAIRSDFVSSVSHELRTPLSQMLIFTELLKLGRLRTDAERERALDIIDQEVRRLIRLVENVLQFSRTGLKRRRADQERVPLPRVARETIDAFRPLAQARGTDVKLDAPADAWVQGDQSALRQILLNLLDNAMKYGPRGQVVHVEVRSENGRTSLAVEDQGPGVPLAEREQVWEGFYRLQRERHSAIAGSGIGLAVVRSLADDMGGRAWVEDAPAGGARFVVELTTSEAP